MKIPNLAIAAVLLVLTAIAIRIVAIVFLVINGIAIFGPEGDTTSIWHWVWAIICALIVFSNAKVREVK
jgi:hypothetical protein